MKKILAAACALSFLVLSKGAFAVEDTPAIDPESVNFSIRPVDAIAAPNSVRKIVLADLFLRAEIGAKECPWLGTSEARLEKLQSVVLPDRSNEEGFSTEEVGEAVLSLLQANIEAEIKKVGIVRYCNSLTRVGEVQRPLFSLVN